MRLNKYLAHAGVASRRAVEELILGGRVRIDGVVVRELGTLVAPNQRVDVDGKTVAPPARHTYVVLHKPAGVVTTMHDPQGRKTVRDFLPPHLPRIVPVGRLDYDTSGLLLLTDDGDLTNRLLHPRYGVEKTYRATIQGVLSASALHELEHGVNAGEFRAAPAHVRIQRRDGLRQVLDVTIHEGRNRQVRKMFEALGHSVVALERLRFGPISLNGLPVGCIRYATPEEVHQLRGVSGGVQATVSKLSRRGVVSWTGYYSRSDRE